MDFPTKIKMAISIHALREEGDRGLPAFFASIFNDFYPRPPRGGRLRGRVVLRLHSSISIHALREEGDCRRGRCRQPNQNFYPRPPRGGRPSIASRPSGAGYFYPRPPRGGRQKSTANSCQIALFLSTPSARRATPAQKAADRPREISIHALREEGDNIGSGRPSGRTYFYPRPPRGGRPPSSKSGRPSARYFYPRPPRGGRPGNPGPSRKEHTIFLSTPSARRATAHLWQAAPHFVISIHALREEGDRPRRAPSGAS